jgi:hypothetical protein
LVIKILCINFTKNINNMTTKLVYLIRRCRSSKSTVRAGISYQSSESNYILSVEMDATGMRMSEVLRTLSNQFSLKTVA